MSLSDERWTTCLQIIADETGSDTDDLRDEDDFVEDLGVNDALNRSIIARLQSTFPGTPATVLSQNPTIGALHEYLSSLPKDDGGDATQDQGQSQDEDRDIAEAVPEKQRVPLSMVLQGNPAKCTHTIFLLPDGSGSGMAYARIPPISKTTCLVGMNSPFLRAPAEYKYSIEDMARHWTKEIQRRQPEGPYILGGWSAGGYYSYEVMRELQRQGLEVSKLILLDSPVRPDFEELPVEVVEHLSERGLMGGLEKVPGPVVEHFRVTLAAVHEYENPVPTQTPPKVYVIWSALGVMDDEQLEQSGLDLSIKVSRFLLVTKPNFGPHGWDRLFPGGELYIAKVSGNHFTLINPPNVDELGSLLGNVVSEDLDDRWTYYPGPKAE